MGRKIPDARVLPIQILVYSCIFSYVLLLFSQCTSDADGPPASLSGTLRVAGSTALQPLTQAAASLFMKQYPQVHIDVQGGGSLAGLDAVTRNQVDIGESDIYADPTAYPSPNLTDHIVCIVPFALIVNPDVAPLSSLKQQQIIDIFTTHTYHNWSQLGGPNLPIQPVVRSDTSGTRASFLKSVLKGNAERAGLWPTQSSSQMLQVVASTPGAIGYVGLPNLDAAQHVHTIAIGGFTATAENISTGKYAFWGYEHMYTMSTNTNPVLAPFLTYMLTTTIQQQAQHMGYISLAQVQLPKKSVRGDEEIVVS